jgi:predicted outer membrane protein
VEKSSDVRINFEENQMIRKFPIASLILLSMTVSAFAQTGRPTPDQTRPGTVPGTQQQDPRAGVVGTIDQNRQGAANIDQYVAACLAVANANEIAMAEFAKDRVQNERMKNFVTMIMSDHEKGLEKARQHAPQHAEVINQLRRQTQTRTDRDGAGRDQRDGTGRQTGQADQPGQGDQRDQLGQAGQPGQSGQPGQPGQLSQPGIGGGAQDQTFTADRAGMGGQNMDVLLQIDREAAEISRQMMIKELERKSGTEFDKDFLKAQVGSHILLVSKLQAVQPHVSERMRSFVDESLSDAKKHLEEARNLAQAMGDDRNRGQEQNRDRN